MSPFSCALLVAAGVKGIPFFDILLPSLVRPYLLLFTVPGVSIFDVFEARFLCLIVSAVYDTLGQHRRTWV